MEKMITTLLDVIGLIAVAAGVYFWAEPHMGPAALVLFGAVVLAGSAFASRQPSSVPVGKRVSNAWLTVSRLVKGARG